MGVPPFVGKRDGAFSVGRKSYSGLVYRGISDPTRRPTVFLWITRSRINWTKVVLSAGGDG